MPIHGEPTRYHVESGSLECQGCQRLFNRRETRFSNLRPGLPCPACGRASVEIRWHLVDIACFQTIGQCSCEHFQFTLQKELTKIAPSLLRTLTQRTADKLRCAHIIAARSYALTLTVRQHEEQRLAGAGRQTEEAQP